MGTAKDLLSSVKTDTGTPTIPPPGTTTPAPKATPGVMIGAPGQERKLSFTPMEGYAPAGRQVGRAVPQATTTTGVTTTPPTGRPGAHPAGPMPGAPNQPIPVTLAGGQGITLHFTCPNCGSNVRQQSTTSDTTSPQSGARH